MIPKQKVEVLSKSDYCSSYMVKPDDVTVSYDSSGTLIIVGQRQEILADLPSNECGYYTDYNCNDFAWSDCSSAAPKVFFGSSSTNTIFFVTNAIAGYSVEACIKCVNSGLGITI